MNPEHKRRFRLVLLIIFIFAAIAIVAVDRLGLFSGESEAIAFVPAHDVSFGGQGDVFVTQDGFFVLMRDSMRFFDELGREVFRHAITMNHASLIGRGGFAAIAEQNGQSLLVFGQNGHLYTVHKSAPIISFTVNPQGLSAIITFDGASHAIYVYSPHGLLLPVDTGHTGPMFFPVAMDISADSRYLAISYLDISDAQINSVVQFISLEPYNGGVFAMDAANHGQFVGLVRFMENNRLLTISDRQISLISPHERVQLLWEIEINNHITAAEFGSDWLALAFGDELLNHIGRPANTITIYNMSGQEIFSYQSARATTSLSSMDNTLIAGSNNHFFALSPAGNTLWQHSAPSNIAHLHFLSNTDTIIAISPTNAAILRHD